MSADSRGRHSHRGRAAKGLEGGVPFSSLHKSAAGFERAAFPSPGPGWMPSACALLSSTSRRGLSGLPAGLDPAGLWPAIRLHRQGAHQSARVLGGPSTVSIILYFDAESLRVGQ